MAQARIRVATFRLQSERYNASTAATASTGILDLRIFFSDECRLELRPFDASMEEKKNHVRG
jgi:hypothetical protein